MSDRDDVNEVRLIFLNKKALLSIYIQIVELDIEVGHVSIIRSEVTTNHIPPHTHDWKIYLRPADLIGDLSCLIQRCIFYLHPIYPNNKRGRNIFNEKRNIRNNI
jgi:hypothetical protein